MLCGSRGAHISIHAPRGGSDRQRSGPESPMANFNPRSPRGERLYSKDGIAYAKAFQSTLPAGGATSYSFALMFASSRFQSTLPAGGATKFGNDPTVFMAISIHAPRGGSDGACRHNRHVVGQFQSTLPAGGATSAASPRCAPASNFNPRSPRGERRDGFLSGRFSRL